MPRRCAYAGYEPSVKALVKGGADVNMVVRDEAGARITALDIARKIGPAGETTALVLQVNAFW